MEISLVSGFLGAGKTTLIKHLLSHKTDRMGKVAFIVNEVGEIGIDGTLLAGEDVDVLEIRNGCICCTVKSDFLKALLEIQARVCPDFLVVEATGVAQPADLLDSVLEPPVSGFSRLNSLVTVVDAGLFSARELLGSFYDNQIRFADILLLNKIDLVAPPAREEIEALLHALNPNARVCLTEYCAVDPSLLFLNYPGRKERPLDHRQVGPHRNWGFQTFSFQVEQAADKGKVMEFLETLPPTLFRMKGWIRFPEGSAFLDFAGGRYRIEPADGSRATALDFVGRNVDEQEILTALRGCLVRDAVQ